MKKYDALFIGAVGARALRRNVVEQACPDHSFDSFLEKIRAVVGGLDFYGQTSFAPIQAFAESVANAGVCNYQSAMLPFATFFDDVRPAYSVAKTTRVNYCLSDIKLLALAWCARQNVVIFVREVARGAMT